MKKARIMLVLIIGVNTALFSTEEVWQDGWMGVGLNFGNYFQNDSNLGNFYTGSLGINSSGYGFWNHNKNFGIFYNYGLLLPYRNPLSMNTIESNYNQIISVDLTSGPGFRHRFNEKLLLHYGIGLNFGAFGFLDIGRDEMRSLDQRFSLGIGGDVGLKFDITNAVYLNIGTALNFNFLEYRLARSTTDNWTNTRQDFSGWNTNYMFGIRPYIAVGVNFYNKKTKLGKPPGNK